MAGVHSGATVDYGDGRLALAVVVVDGTGGTHVGPTVDLGNGRYARAVMAMSADDGTHASGALVRMDDGSLSRAVVPVEIGSGSHSGGVVDLGNGKYARAVVLVESLAAGQSAYAVVRYDLNGDPVTDEPVDFPTRWGVVAHWPLDEVSDGSGPVTRVDAHGNNDLTDNNTVTNAVGKIAAQCAQFTGANNEYLSAEDNADLSFTGDEEWGSAWVNFDSLGVLRGLMGRRTSTAARDVAVFFDTNNPNGNRIKLRGYNAAGTEIASAPYDVALSTGTWYFIVWYFSALLDEFGISVDGSDFTTVSAGGQSLSDVNARFLLGILQATTTNPHNGRMESVTLGKDPPLGLAALASEIRDTLYNGGDGVAYPFS